MLGRIWLASAIVSSTASAAPLVAVVVADGAGEVVARVEGQVSDLEVELVIAREVVDDDAAARALAARHGARVVVWFRLDGDAWLVHVAEPAKGARLVRRVVADGALATSAAAESAALVVRSVLRALAGGGAIGVEQPAPAAAPPRAPPPPPPPAAIASPARRPYAELAWGGVVDGATLRHGIGARLGGAAGAWRAAVIAELMPATAHATSLATIEVERVMVGAVIGVDVIGGARWRAGVEVAASGGRYERATIATAGALAATPASRTWIGAVSPAARLGYRVAPGVWMTAQLGADVVAGAPEFAIETPAGSVTHTRLRAVQPRAALGVAVDVF